MSKTVKVKASIRNGKVVKAHTRLIERVQKAGHGEEWAKLHRHKEMLRGHHPQDDKPMGEYDGYTVSDARRQINDRITRIKNKVTPAAERRAAMAGQITKWKKSPQKKAQDKRYREKRKADKEKSKEDPKFKHAKEAHIQSHFRYTYLPRGMKKSMPSPGESKRIKKALEKGGFKSVNEAREYYRNNRPDKK